MWQWCGDLICAGDFNSGFFWGAVTLTGLFLLCWIADLAIRLFRGRRCRSVVVAGTNGSLEVTSGAVASIVGILGAEFSSLSLRYTKIYRTRAGYRLAVGCACHIAPATSLAAVAEQFRARIQSGVADTLGISEPIEVKVVCLAAKQQ
ncbi:MAG: hypothetical protein AB7F40_09225 [Victivallaceae bacterium]|nr:hypothetical protein [Victivallaceae bacterium]